MTNERKLRGTLPDAETEDAILVLKLVPVLFLTYQIKLLVYMARSKGKQLLLRLPIGGSVSPALQSYMTQHRKFAVVEYVLPRVTV